jgi:hypothetical protein
MSACAHTDVENVMVARTAAATWRSGKQTGETEKRDDVRVACAAGTAAAPARRASQPGWKADITQRKRGGAVAFGT